MLHVYSVDRYTMDRFNSITLESINIGYCKTISGAKNLALGYIHTDIKNFDLNKFIYEDENVCYCKYTYADGRFVVEISECPVFETIDDINTYIKELPTFSK